MGLCKITENQIDIDIIEIIQFSLQNYGLWRYLHAHTTHWSQSLAIEINPLFAYLLLLAFTGNMLSI